MGTPNSLTQNGRTWQTTGDLHTNASSSASNQNKVKDKITFNNAVRVVLIPTRDEYRAAGLSDVMWWEDSDYSNFKESAMNELKNLVQARGKMDTKTALNILYQPHSNSQYIDEIFDDNPTNEIQLDEHSNVASPQSIVAVSGIDSCKKPSVIMLRKNNNSSNETIGSDKKYKSQEDVKSKNLEVEDEKNSLSSDKEMATR